MRVWRGVTVVAYSKTMSKVFVTAFYQFAAFPDFEEWREPLQELCAQCEVKGTVLLAPEGVNGTIAGTCDGVRAVLEHLRTDSRFTDLNVKESFASKPPFQRMKVKLKREIVTMGVPAVDPTEGVGAYIAPEEWNALISDPDVVVVDTRNEYEVAIGSFKGALNPELRSFRKFAPWLREQFSEKKNLKVAMFCTGGIRCEKSTAFLKREGVEEVFHLKGGILKYLETVPESQSLWEGECFVFDERVSVAHGLREGSYEACLACGDPVSAADKTESDYVEGVQCRGCVDRTTAEQKAKFAARFEQTKLAKLRESR